MDPPMGGPLWGQRCVRTARSKAALETRERAKKQRAERLLQAPFEQSWTLGGLTLELMFQYKKDPQQKDGVPSNPFPDPTALRKEKQGA